MGVGEVGVGKQVLSRCAYVEKWIVLEYIIVQDINQLRLAPSILQMY